MALFNDSDRLRFVNDGQKVTCDMGGGRGIGCVVIHAHGYHAYVRSLTTTGDFAGWEKLVPIDRLFPEITA